MDLPSGDRDSESVMGSNGNRLDRGPDVKLADRTVALTT